MEKFGLIGHPIAHSESPAVFAAAYGGRWPYDLIEGEDFELSWKRFLDEYRAINITAPFKELAFRKLLECGVVDESVRSIGAVNIAVKEADGLVHGYNSDYLGVRLLLEERGFGEGKTVLVVGFGGAGKAAAAAARSLGCDVPPRPSRRPADLHPLHPCSPASRPLPWPRISADAQTLRHQPHGNCRPAWLHGMRLRPN